MSAHRIFLGGLDLVPGKGRKLSIYQLKNETVEKKTANFLTSNNSNVLPRPPLTNHNEFFPLVLQLGPCKDQIPRCLKSHSLEVKPEVLILEQHMYSGTCCQMQPESERGKPSRAGKKQGKLWLQLSCLSLMPGEAPEGEWLF